MIPSPLPDDDSTVLLDIEAVQQVLNRSRASVYRYANTDPSNPNPPYDPTRLNPELREDIRDALRFHPTEVTRFARDVLRLKRISFDGVSLQEPSVPDLLLQILQELQRIRLQLEKDG
jgi:hypothetical protein